MAPISATGTDRASDGSQAPEARRRARTTGFTLVEVLVALAVIALLTAALSPLLLPSPARTLSAAAGELVVALRETRRLAQTSREGRELVVDTAARRYAIAGSGHWRPLPDGSTAEVTTAQALIRDRERAAIAFFADGSSSGGRITLGLDGHARQIDVEWLTGRIALASTRP